MDVVGSDSCDVTKTATFLVKLLSVASQTGAHISVLFVCLPVCLR